MTCVAFVASSSLLAVVAAWLWRRINGACAEARRALGAGGPSTPYLDALARCVEHAVDHSLLADAGAGGLRGVELRYREHQDPYRSVADLLADIGRQARGEGEGRFDGLIKVTYQLSYTLGIPLGRLGPCLDLLVR